MAEFDKRIYVARSEDISITTLEQSQVLNLNPSNSFGLNIYAPAKTICKTQVNTIVIGAPAGATSGNHAIYVNCGSYGILHAVYPYNKDIVYDCSDFLYKGVGEVITPTDATAQLLALKDVVFTADSPISILYENNTNIKTTRTLQFKVTARKQVIA